MAIRLSDLQKRTRSIEVQFQGDTVNVSYLVNVITPAFLDDRGGAVEQVKAAVEAWDVLDDDGQPIPPAEIAHSMPLSFLNEVLAAIVADMRMASEQEKKVSSPG